MTLQSPETPSPTISKTSYRYVKYTFFKADPAWKKLPREALESSKKDFQDRLMEYQKEFSIRTYSLVGTRADVDFATWLITDSVEALQEVHSSLLKTTLGKYLFTPYSYLAMFKPSEYFGKSTEPAPVGSKYLFVYPLTKKREWYGLPFEERQRIMRDHVQTGHKYSSVKIHTAYSFGLDDYEFILSFETDHPQDFLNLVMELRTGESSKYTALETPLFTCVNVEANKMLELLGP
jgi:chlorite dismutase